MDRLDGFDAVIATGSRNSGRYFQHYFSKVPHIIRGQRTSVAVLDGSETPDQLEALSQRHLPLLRTRVSQRHPGPSCRRTSTSIAFSARWWDGAHLADHHRYYNNYTYHKALWLMEAVDLLENGFVLFKEDPQWVSPVGALHYQRYDDLAEVEARIAEGAEHIQRRVGHGGLPLAPPNTPDWPTMPTASTPWPSCWVSVANFAPW